MTRPLWTTPPEALLHQLLLDSRILLYLRTDRDGAIVDGNAVAESLGTLDASDGERPSLLDRLTPEDRSQMEGWLAQRDSLPGDLVLLNFVTESHEVHTYQCRILPLADGLALIGEPDLEESRTLADELLQLNNELSVLSRENIRRNRELQAAQERLSETLEELRTSYWHLERIQEYLPLCMGCERLKTGDAQWTSLVDYFRSNDILVSHGLCPSCADQILDEDAP